MKSTTRLSVAIACSAAVLTGCTASPAPDSSGSITTDMSSPAATTTGTVTAEAASSSRTVVDVEEAKAAAIAAGRPEAAWDKDCVAWDLPEAESDAGPSWANGLAHTWLEAHDADCPDAIVFPHYYVESFTQGAPGELVVTLDDQASRDYAMTESEETGLKNMALEAFRDLFAEHRDLKRVTYTVEGRDLSGTVDQDAWRKITAHWLWADPDFSDDLYTEIYGDLPADFSSELAVEYYEDFHGPDG